jgi:opacity protein-like surface antigen
MPQVMLSPRPKNLFSTEVGDGRPGQFGYLLNHYPNREDMMNTRLISLCVALSVLPCARPVLADGSTIAAAGLPVFVASTPDWSGFYLGVHTGGFVNGRTSSLFQSGPSGPGGGGGGGAADVLGDIGGAGGAGANAVRGFGRLETGPTAYQGLHGGYNLQFGSVVLGVEGDINFLGRIEDVLGSVRARSGYAVGPVLLYVTAGAAFQSHSGGLLGAFVVGNGGNGGNGGTGSLGGLGGPGGAGGTGIGGPGIVGVSGSRSGFVGGAGAEVRLSPQVSAGVEALYYNFSSSSQGTGLPRDTVALNGRLTYHFGDFGPHAPLPTANWGGLYGGGQIGAVYNSSQGIIDQASSFNGLSGGAGGNGVGASAGGGGGGGGSGAVAFAGLQRFASFIGGVHLGYNFQSGNIVYGGEGDIDFSPDRSHTYLASVRGRLGWANEVYLLYGTAGVAFNRNEAVRGVFAANGGNGANGGNAPAGAGGAGGLGGLAQVLRNGETRTGFVVGGGLEAKVHERVSLGVEGLYWNFGSGAASPAFIAGGSNFAGSTRNDAFVVRTRLSVSLLP